MKIKAAGNFIIVALIICFMTECKQSTQNSRVSQNWPWFRGPAHNGISDETLNWPEKGPKQVWKLNMGVGHSAISVVDGFAYTMGNKNDTDMVVCLDARSGKEIWKHSYACEATYFAAKPFDGPGATPTVDQGIVYTFSRSGHAFALEAKTGAVIWKRNLEEEEGAKRPQWGFAGSALVNGDHVIFNSAPGGICLDRETGVTIWKTGMDEGFGEVDVDNPVPIVRRRSDEGGYATPVPIIVNGKKCVVILGTQTLTVVDPQDGSVVWKTDRPQPIGLNAADPVVEGTNVFISAGRQCGGARYDISGDTIPKWDNKNMNNHWQTCVLWNGYLYGCEGNHASGAGRSPVSLRCLNWETGELMWEENSVDFFGLIVVDNKLLMLNDSGFLIAAEASPAGYKEIGRTKVLDPYCFTAPVLVNGYVYARNTTGDIVCMDMQP